VASNTVTKSRSYSGSQAGAFVDTVTFTTLGDTLLIVNRSSTVGISFTFASGGTAATPTDKGDDCFFLPASGTFSIDIPGITQVKLIGDATSMAYTVSVI
jgi:hypothetical protein